MSINKNFVVRHGFEVSSDLILADADTRKVGIGTTRPTYDFTVAGGIGATDFYLTGIGTFVDELNVGLGGTVLTVLGEGNSIGIGTTLPEYLLDIRSPVSTGQTALYIQGDVRITGDIIADDISIDDITLDEASINYLNVLGIGTLANLYVPSSGIATIATGIVTNLSGTNLNYSGIGTITNLRSTSFNNSGIGTITTLNSTNGTITNLSGTNLNYSGIGTITTLNSTNGTITNLSGTAGTITTLNSTTGTITNLSGTNLNYTGISTALSFVSTVSNGTSPLTVTSSTVVTNLNADLLDGQQGTYYNDLINSTGTLPDARFTGTYTGVSFNSTGIATFASFSGSGASLTTLNATNISSGTLNNARLPSNISVTNLNITGISTLGTVRVSSGIITATSGIVTYYGDGSNLIGLPGNPSLQTVLNVGNTSTIGMSIVGVITASSFVGDGSGLTGVGIGSTGSINTTGIITATSFVGSGAQLTDIVSGVGISTEGGLVGTGATVLDFRGTGISTVTVASGIGTIFIEGGGGGFSVTDDTSTDSTYYPVFVDSTTGTPTQTSVSSTNLQFNPLTGTLFSTAFTSLSDATKKTNIRPIENSIELTKQLEGVRFDWINNNKPSLGLIAQEVEKVLPELVETSTDGTKSVSYGNIVGVLIEAIKEQQVRIEDLERKLNA